jgi:FkbH-like protein
MELEEVKRAFPGIVAIEFPRNNPARLWRMLGELRDLFGRPDLMEEDALRQASIQTSAAIRDMGEPATSLEFLEGLDATVTLDWRGDPSDKRPLQLINKTNQFNLNGCRIGEAEWRRCLEKPSTVQAVVSYKDRFGPLGKVSVVLGTRNRDTLKVTHWVMSCRAFSRRVEHHTLAGLFLETGVEWIEFAFEETVKNKPLQGFFRTAGIRPDAEGVYRLARAAFPAQGDRLPHQVLVLKK